MYSYCLLEGVLISLKTYASQIMCRQKHSKHMGLHGSYSRPGLRKIHVLIITKCLLYFICYVLKDILADLLCFTDVCLRLYKASCATLIHWGCMLVHFILIINGTKSVWILYYVNHTQCKCPESYDQKLWKYCKNV